MRAVLKDCNKNEDLFRRPTYKHEREQQFFVRLQNSFRPFRQDIWLTSSSN